jgi:hypothetical protein
MKDADSSTRLNSDKNPPQAPEQQPVAPKDEHRAQPGSEEHRENQQELGVGPDHRTEDMKRGHRGTFP